jgi:hypothetical protein
VTSAAPRFAPPDSREETWPRVYRPSRGHRLLLGGLGVLVLGGGIAGAVAALLLEPQRGARLGLALLGAAFALLGAFLLAALRVERLVLHPDAIELVELGRGRRRLRKDESLGLRVLDAQYGQKVYVFELRGLGRKPLKTTMIVERDAVLDAWLAELPDLDAADRERSEAELLRSTTLGQDAPERRAALDAARKISRVATPVAIAVSAWGWLRPQPYPAAIAALAAVPLAALAILLARPGRFTVEGRRNDARPGLALPFLLPGIVLALRASLDLHVLDVRPIVLLTAAGATALALLLGIGDPALRTRWYGLPLLLLLYGAPYCWGALAEANALLDRGARVEHRAGVLGKHVVSGKHTQHVVRLGPWGPRTSPDDVDVDAETYRALEPGDTACLDLAPGALRARWFVVRPCE